MSINPDDHYVYVEEGDLLYEWNVQTIWRHANQTCRNIRYVPVDALALVCSDVLDIVSDPDHDALEQDEHLQRIHHADLSYPVIVADGAILDGQHRVCKALLAGKKILRVQYLDSLPVPEKIYDKEKEDERHCH